MPAPHSALRRVAERLELVVLTDAGLADYPFPVCAFALRSVAAVVAADVRSGRRLIPLQLVIRNRILRAGFGFRLPLALAFVVLFLSEIFSLKKCDLRSRYEQRS